MTTHWSKDPEYLRAQRRAIAFDGEGKLKLWASCFACAQVVGRYEKGATIALAKELHCSTDTVEARARAAVAYRLLWHIFRDNPEIQRRLRAIRRTLGYSHFAEAARWLRADLPGLEVFAQLDTAASAGAGVKAMAGHTNGQDPIELPVWKLTDATIHDLIERHGREAAILVLPGPYSDYAGQTKKVNL